MPLPFLLETFGQILHFRKQLIEQTPVTATETIRTVPVPVPFATTPAKVQVGAGLTGRTGIMTGRNKRQFITYPINLLSIISPTM
jgi:hypothetical protein